VKVLDPIWRRANDMSVVFLNPALESLIFSSNKLLPEECAHGGANGCWSIRFDSPIKNDKSGATNCL